MEKENAELTIQTKITARYCFHFRMAKMPLHIGTLHDVGKGMGKTDPLTQYWWECKLMQSSKKINLAIKVKNTDIFNTQEFYF